jgi:GDP-mannose 4,6 dehydratase
MNIVGSSNNSTSTVGASLSVIALIIIMTVTTTNAFIPTIQRHVRPWITESTRRLYSSFSKRSSTSKNANAFSDSSEGTPLPTTKGRLLVLGGTGYLGQEVCKKAIQEGYSVVTLSRRGTPSSLSSSGNNNYNNNNNNNRIDYRKGDARQKESIRNILQEGNVCGIVHCIGLLFDTQSGLGSYNVYVSGSKSLPDNDSTYDTITRQTAFNAIDATIEYVQNSTSNMSKPIPFCFTSAAEAGWPDVLFGKQIERIMPQFIHRYMVAKRAVEHKLLSSPTNIIRPIIVRPSLIYTKNQLASIPAVTTFTLLNQIGLPFVDRPVTVDSLSTTIVKSMSDEAIRGIQRYPQIDQISAAKQS